MIPSKARLEPIWDWDPPDRTGFAIDILPPTFDMRHSPCVLCGGMLDVGWECTRCNADHFPAVQRLRKARDK